MLERLDDKFKVEEECLLAIKDDYFKRHQQVPSLEFCYIIFYYGTDFLKSIEDYSFEYTCVEMDFLKKEQKGKEFETYNKLNLAKNIGYFIGRIPQQDDLIKKGRTLTINMPSRRMMLSYILGEHIKRGGNV